MKSHARVVIVGGGIVGVSILYHLTKKGWADAVLLEKMDLTHGSTWHAAGLLPLFNMSYSIGQLHKYSVDLYKSLEAETGQAVSFHPTGNLRLATNRDRMDEYMKYCGTANTIGVPFELIGPEEVKKLWPLSEIEGIVGALFHPFDGHVAPADVTQALAIGARTGGAAYRSQSTRIGRTPVRRKPVASSSRRLNSDTPSASARSSTPASRRSSNRPRLQRPATWLFTPMKYSGGVMLW